MQAPSCYCLASPVLSAAPFTARPCSVRPDWLPAGHHGWSGVCRTTPIFAGDLLPDSALIVVSFYRCTCLILSGQALAAQKDLQVQVVHPEDLFLSVQGSPVQLLRLVVSAPGSPEPAMLPSYIATTTASSEACLHISYGLALPYRSPTPFPMASCKIGTTCIMSGNTPSAASLRWTPQTAASF